MERSDMAFNIGYLVILIMAGVWLLAWAIGTIGLGEAFLFWLLSAGILLAIIGAMGSSD